MYNRLFKRITIGLIILLLSACSSTKSGIDYKAHNKRSQQFAKRAGCWH